MTKTKTKRVWVVRSPNGWIRVFATRSEARSFRARDEQVLPATLTWVVPSHPAPKKRRPR